MATLEEAARVKAERGPELLALPYVAGLAVSALQGQAVLLVFLRRPLRPQEWLPGFLDGVPLVPRVVGEVQPLPARTGRWRPAPCGVSVGHPNVTAGTLGAVLWYGNQPFAVSNNHILAWSNLAAVGDATLQPGPADGGGPGDEIGTLEGFVPVVEWGNLVDLAWVRPATPETVSDAILGLRAGARVVSLAVEPGDVGLGEQVAKSGRSSGVTRGAVSGLDVTIGILWQGSLVALFDDLVWVQGLGMMGGDSGSALLGSRGQLAGLVFAGDDYGNGYACRTANIVRAMAMEMGFRPAAFEARATWTVPLLVALGFVALSRR